MAGPGVECSNPATLIRSSATTEIPRSISTVHIAPTASSELTELLIDFSCLGTYCSLVKPLVGDLLGAASSV